MTNQHWFGYDLVPNARRYGTWTNDGPVIWKKKKKLYAYMYIRWHQCVKMVSGEFSINVLSTFLYEDKGGGGGGGLPYVFSRNTICYSVVLREIHWHGYIGKFWFEHKKGNVPDSKVHWPTWGPSGADRTQVGPILGPWTLLSGVINN